MNVINYVESHLDNDSHLRNLKDQLFVEDVMILLGNPNADLTAIARATSHAAILKFVTSGLRMMRAVSSTATYPEAWSGREGNLSKYSNAIRRDKRTFIDVRSANRPIWEIMVDQMKDVPPEDFAALPCDGASQVDHYIYGLPKRD